jgi:transposase InsO family protein
MDLAGYVVQAVLVEGRSVREVAAVHGISKSWLYELLARYHAHGDAGLTPRSKRPRRSPSQVPVHIEDEIVELRKSLAGDGLDAGPQTIHYHLSRRHRDAPSPSSVWRVLVRRGFVTPQPRKRPRSSYVRFEAALPNECWQADVTHWHLGNGSGVEILNIIDDHSRLVVASVAFVVTRATDVVAVFAEAMQRHGVPAAVLTDNGAIFTAAYRGGRCALETELERMGIVFKHSSPYHPQTCGKVERFHQTLKRYLDRQRKARSLRALQAQLDSFVAYYNHERPHRARDRVTPAEAFAVRTKATPAGPALGPAQHRVRRDRVDATGRVTLRRSGCLHHICVGRAHKGQVVLVLVADLDVRILGADGELLRHLTLDPSRRYQPLGG